VGDNRGFHYSVSDSQLAEYATWTIEQRLRWVVETARFTLSLQTRDERIQAYRLKGGENVKYYDTYGWPENF
jgi:hypothetical protein